MRSVTFVIVNFVIVRKVDFISFSSSSLILWNWAHQPSLNVLLNSCWHADLWQAVGCVVGRKWIWIHLMLSDPLLILIFFYIPNNTLRPSNSPSDVANCWIVEYINTCNDITFLLKILCALGCEILLCICMLLQNIVIKVIETSIATQLCVRGW